MARRGRQVRRWGRPRPAAAAAPLLLPIGPVPQPLPPSRSFRAALLRWIFVYVLAPIVMLLTFVSLSALMVIWSTTHGGGMVGTLILDHEQCAHRDCTWYGTFFSDDQSVLYGDVPLADSFPDGPVNQVVNVRYSDEFGEAYLANGSRAWVEPAVLTLVGVVYTAGAATWLIRYLTRRRRWRRQRALARAVPTSPL